MRKKNNISCKTGDPVGEEIIKKNNLWNDKFVFYSERFATIPQILELKQ